MNTLIPYNWLKEYLKTDLSVEEFAKLTTNAGNSVEYIHDLGARLDKMVVGVVKELKAHPNADKLKLAMTDIGGEVVQIVCGGLNLKEGMRVAVASPGAKVKWHGEGDYVELEEAKIRGEKSFGMICAAEEIGFDKLALQGPTIWDISGITDAKAGTPLADALDLNDFVMDIEATTNRPDCMSIIGQAMEGSAVTGDKFEMKTPEAKPGSGREIKVVVKNSDLCPHYQAVVLENVKIGPSPWWLQKKILLSGHRPINNLVDITNFILHEYGQPLHTFDADKLEGDSIIVRTAKKGEKMVALDGVEYELDPSMLVIADAKKPVAIAGVMGGEATGTAEDTTTVVIESATFDPTSVRKTSRALNLQSDSQQLFEKGLSTESTGRALARAVELIEELAGGKVASEIYSVRASEYKPLSFPFNPKRACKLIGVEIKEKEMIGILERLGFRLKKNGEIYDAEVPFWRDHDIEAPIDLVEEVARVYGYDKLPSELPIGEMPKVEAEPILLWERKAKEFLRGAGFNEAYSYAFVSDAQLQKFGVDMNDVVRLSNPLTSDLEYMRPSLVPSMLTVIEQNQHHDAEMNLFEIAPVYRPQKGDIPDQGLGMVMACTGDDGEEVFMRAKGALERFFRETGVKRWRLERGAFDDRWHKARSAKIWVGGHLIIGMIGEVAPSLAKKFDIDQRVVLVSLSFESLVEFFSASKQYRPIPLFPEIKRDLAFVVDDRTEFGNIEEKLSAVNKLVQDIELFDVYRGKGVEEGKKSMAVHVTLRAADRTLESGEADEIMEKLEKVIEKEFSGIIRG